MYLHTRNWILLPLFAATASVGTAITLETDPMGILELEVPAQSDALISLPLHRTAVYSGQIATVEGNRIDLVTTGASPDWSEDEWVYVADTQLVTYYALFMSGDLEGCYYTISGNDADSLELDLEEGSLDGFNLNDQVLQIIPYWTLGTFFGEQDAVTASASITGLGERSEVHFFSNVEGVNPASSEIFYYYEGSDFGGDGWRLKGDSLTTLHDDQPIAPDRAFVFRNVTDATVELLLPGYVQMTQSAFVIEGSESSNDLRVSSASMLPTSLADSKLIETGGFQATDSISGLSGDQVLVVDNFAEGFNKAAVAIYYYYNGSAFGGPGWRLKGGSLLTIMDAVEVFQPGQGVILRKAASSETDTHLWHFLPGYLSPDID
ncbi:TIGR02597 family protein [Coraliomargarita sp. SDUM461004]|uniref:TIGR02597 family protein n=1 Tax=Thalassobacterium sedimentorum TaxID=3041258 RepID=A0ABU1AHY3_9BACT|nr:TIGR02597 family protein [Coraliomargarita sp. SDUM461004]MDQ8194400.1 TIGR02597 family protein [Coraliomargarita sp. SDUM461004]